MSDEERVRWNEKYASGAYADRKHPTPLLEQWAPELPAGRALDVACGAGRNSLYLATGGWDVDGADISAAGLARAREDAEARGLGVSWIEADLDESPDETLPEGPYDLIVVVRYVNRKLYPHLLRRLRPGGIIVYEQHLASDEDVIGPKTRAFRLRPNELLRDILAAAGDGGRLLYYREGIVTDPDGRRAALAQLVLQAGDGASGNDNSRGAGR